jgi:hypothetical protein
MALAIVGNCTRTPGRKSHLSLQEHHHIDSVLLVGFLGASFSVVDTLKISMGRLRMCITKHKYNAETKIWEQLPSMPHPNREHSVAYLKGSMYVIGGRFCGAWK